MGIGIDEISMSHKKTPTLNNNFRKKLGLPSLSVVLVIGSLITLALKATSDSPLAVN